MRDAGGEEFDAVTVAHFRNLRDNGAFVLSWEAHGLCYGIPKSVNEVLVESKDAIVNLSRGVVREAERVFPTVEVIHLAASPEVLAERLPARGREPAEEIDKRLSREASSEPKGVKPVNNDRPLGLTLDEISARYFAMSG